MRFSEIIENAFLITKNHKYLWFFGFLLSGTTPLLTVFNLNEKVYQVLEKLYTNIFYYFDQPKELFWLSLSILFVSGVGLLGTNIARLAFALMLGSILKKTEFRPNKVLDLLAYRNVLYRIIVISGATSCVMVLVYIVLAAPFFPLKNLDNPGINLLTLAIFIGIVMTFVISCVNLFSCLFVVFYKRSVFSALNLAIDLVRSKWLDIFVFGIVLQVLQFMMLVLVNGVSEVLSAFVKEVWIFWQYFGFLQLGSPLLITSGSHAIIFWISGAIYSVFFNTCIILLFFKLIKDIENPEYKIETTTPLMDS